MTTSYVITNDGTFGRYLSSLTINGVTWTFTPATSVALRVYDVNAQTETDYDLSDFTYGGSATAGDLTTLTYDGAGDLLGIRLKLHFYTETDSIGLRYETTACPSELAIMFVRFPNVVALPFGTLGNQRGVLSTTSIPVPQDVSSDVVNSYTAGFQYAGLFDTVSKTCLMMWVEEENGNATGIQIVGATTATQLYVEHLSDRRYEGGKLFSKTYRVHFEIFVGLSVVGTLCAEDFAHRFREWATDPARPWMARGRWRDSALVSRRIKRKGLVFTQQDLDYNRFRIALMRLDEYIGIPGAILGRWMFSPTSFLDAPDPDVVVIDASYETEMAYLQDQGVDISVYTLTRAWLTTLTGDYDPTDFNGVDLTPFFHHELDGSLKVSGGGTYLFNFAHPESVQAISDLIAGYFALHTGAKPHGVYMDIHTTLVHDGTPGGIGIEQEDDASATDWTFAAHQEGVMDSVLAVRDSRRAVDPDMIIGGETIEFASPLCFDLVGTDRPDGDHIEAGNDYGAGEYIFGEYVRMCALAGVGLFGNQIIDPFGVTQASFIYATIQQITSDWLRTGIAAVCDRNAFTFVADPVETGNFYGPLWKWIRKLVRMALGEAYDGFSGRLMRGLGDTFVTTMLENSGRADAKIVLLGWQYPIQTCVRKAEDGHLDIIICHCWQTGMISPFGSPTSGDRTVTVALTRARYELDNDPKVIVRNDDGAITLLAAWTDATISINVTVSEGTVTLLQVLDDTESSAFGNAPTFLRGRRMDPDFKEDRRRRGLSGTHKGLGTRGGPPYW